MEVNGNRMLDKDYIKLDCVANNPKWNQFYIDNWYKYIGEGNHHNQYREPFFRRKDERIF